MSGDICVHSGADQTVSVTSGNKEIKSYLPSVLRLVTVCPAEASGRPPTFGAAYYDPWICSNDGSRGGGSQNEILHKFNGTARQTACKVR